MRGYLWLCNDHSHEGSLDVTSLALAITSYPPDTFGQKVARSRSSRQAIASASHDGDNCHMIYHKSQRRNERGGISFLTLAHPERPYIYADSLKIIRWKQNHVSGEFGEWVENTAIHNPLTHLFLTRWGATGRVQSKACTERPSYPYTKPIQRV